MVSSSISISGPRTLADTPKALAARLSGVSEPRVFTSQLKPGAIVAGKFTVVETIKTGQMGSVYLVKGPGGELCAMKVPNGNTAEILGPNIKALKGESDTLRILSEGSPSRHIPRFFEGPSEDHNHLILEYIDGVALDVEIKRGVPLKELLGITVDVIGALKTAWEFGIVHKDVKPANVVRRKDGSAVLLDWGLAKYEKEEGSVIGTPAYMSPEQMWGEDLDHRSDIYSTGILLHEMIARERPFSQSEKFLGFLRIKDEKEKRGLPVIQGIPGSVQKLLSKMTESDREKRHQNYDELLGEIKAIQQELSEIEERIAAFRYANKNCFYYPPRTVAEEPPSVFADTLLWVRA